MIPSLVIGNFGRKNVTAAIVTVANTIPTAADVLIMGLAHEGEAFCDIDAKAAVNSISNGFAHEGQAFVGAAG